MTIWTPRLTESDAPLYQRIADALERDLGSGVLLAGSRLPTHRELARQLGVTAVTITRAYAEAAKRGLVETTTGRGSFVRNVRRETAAGVPEELDLATNLLRFPLPPLAQATMQRMAHALVTASYEPPGGSERHRAAGASWLGAPSEASRVIVTAGAQQAMFLSLAALTRAGDTVLTESVTYHGLRWLASLLHLRLEAIPMDRYGLMPDAIRRTKAKVVYTTPSLQNPTGTVLPEKRRRELAALAEQRGLTIVEDDVYGFLLDTPPPSIRSFAPERTILLTGTGKSLAPALRTGFALAPEALLPKMHAALRASSLFTSPALAEVAVTWMEDGTAARIIEQKRAEITLRNRLARRLLGNRVAAGDPRSPHLWVEVPRRWNGDSFTEEARRRKVLVASGSTFAVDDDALPRHVRICLGAATSVAEMEKALHILTAIDEERAEGPVV
ncbi:MAG TPA: PLP-dependent aminotransferase family protein [Thermoanaerobaculia bacterium]